MDWRWFNTFAHLAALARQAVAQAADGAVRVRRRVCGQHCEVLAPPAQQPVLAADVAACAAGGKRERLSSVACAAAAAAVALMLCLVQRTNEAGQMGVHSERCSTG